MRKIFIIIVLIFAFLVSTTKAQVFRWAKQYECSSSIATDVIVDHSNNVISVGWFQGPIDLNPGIGSFIPTPTGQIVTSSYISKLDTGGNFIWGGYFSKGAGNPLDNVRLHSVDIDNQNNILLMGMYRDSLNLNLTGGSDWVFDPTPNNSDWDNIFIAKYNPNGSYLWSKTLHSSITVNGYGLSGHKLKLDHANNIILSGRFNHSVDFDPGPGQFNLVGPTITNYFPFGDKFLLKLDSTGNFMWVRKWAETEDWVFNDAWYGANELDVDGNNNIFMPISFRDTLNIDPQVSGTNLYSKGKEDIALIKMSPSGSLVWYKQIGDTAKDYCNSLATDINGNIFYAVRTNSGKLDVNPSFVQNNFYWLPQKWGHIILKLNNNGSFLWAKKNITQDSSTHWWGEGIATNHKGDLYLTTKIEPYTSTSNQWDLDPGLGTFIVNSLGSDDIALQNLDKDGNFIWGGVLGGNASDWSYNICTDTAKGVYLTGHFFLNADLNPTSQVQTMNNTGTSYDAFVVKLNNCTKASNQLEQNCDSVFFNNQVFYQDAVLKNYYTSSLGCDSIHTVLIDVTKNYDTLIVDTCKNYTWNGTTYINSGFYIQHYGNVNGCDSASILDLTIHKDTVIVLHISNCDSTSVNGVSYTQTGTFYQYYNSLAGCDSNYVIYFTKSPVDTSLFLSSPNTLTANEVNASYQWLDCSTMQTITGATNSFYTISQSGNYACIITKNGCTDTSGCWALDFGPNSLKEYEINFSLYPNPSKGSYHLLLDAIYHNILLEVRTISGQLVWVKKFEELKETTFHLDEPSGVYLLYLQQEGQTKEVKKLLKW